MIPRILDDMDATITETFKLKIQVPSKAKRIFHTLARIIALVGGRGSAKSQTAARYTLSEVQSTGADILCGREFQNSIDESVHKLLCALIEKLKIPGVAVTEKKINFPNGGEFRYKGFARNSSGVRSAEGFKIAWVEEAQYLSQNSIDDLLPTIRETDSKIILTANLMASNDPFSKRFINPFKAELDRNGFYEDDMHLVIVMNWRDNPWWNADLEKERVWDYENRPRADYDHIWEGAYNDKVEGSIIRPEWFDAAIDAHLELGFKPQGFKILSHDPADSGDPKAIVLRHGPVILNAQERIEGDVNEGCDWATDLAVQHNVDVFNWDAGGLGLSLKRQVAEALKGKKIEVKMFNGAESPINPGQVYEPIEEFSNESARTNENTFRNKRAQYYWMLRDRFLKTYRAVIKKEYINPDELISISSEIQSMAQFRSEVCRVPRKPNGSGYIQIASKDEMKRLGIDSPNLADSAMMNMDLPEPVRKKTTHGPIPNLQRFGHTPRRP